MSKIAGFGFLCLAVSWLPTSQAASILSEGFEDIVTLTADGWSLQNNSDPIGTTDWFQGNVGVFAAQAGPSDSYIAANFNNTTGVGIISNWLITPELNLSNGDLFNFYTRAAEDIFPDRLQVRLSTNGASTDVGSAATDVGDFSTLLLDINPALTTTGYPTDWTQYSLLLSGLTGGETGRIGLRYFVTSAGPSGANSNYIGIDSVEYIAVTAVPAPPTLLLSALGLVGLGVMRRKSA